LPGIAFAMQPLYPEKNLAQCKERMRFSFRWMVWLCLSLMLWTAVAESTHNHPNKTASSSCSICVAAHSSAPTANSLHSRPIFAAIGLLQEDEVIAKALLSVFDLGIRGPPAL
jgi:hypothetical protein